MKKIATSFAAAGVLLITSMSSASTAIVYFFTGGPIEGPRGTAMTIITEFMSARYSTVKFTIVHNSASGSVCNQIKKEMKTSPNDKIILAGHSYGGNATVSVSDCLQKAKINVNMIIPLDPVQRPFTAAVDVVPENVAVVYSFYQEQDGLIRGNKHLHRADGSDREITNTLTTVPPNTVSPHHSMVDVLMEAGVIQGLIDEGLRGG